MSCSTKITADLINDCSVDPVLGLTSGVIVNVDDIDTSALVVDGATVTGFALKSGTTGYNVTWLKRMGYNSNSYNYNATERDGFTHTFACQLAGFSAENAERINELRNGSFVLIAKSKFTGVDNADAFKVFGLTAGLSLSEATHNSNENSGAITYVLSTEDGNYEKYLFQVLSLTDYDTTAAAYETLFAAA